VSGTRLRCVVSPSSPTGKKPTVRPSTSQRLQRPTGRAAGSAVRPTMPMSKSSGALRTMPRMKVSIPPAITP
jgi:hypothetical protein